MNLARIEYLRGELEAERISYGELAEIDDAFAELNPATLRDRPENATAGDMLEELADHANRTNERLRAGRCPECGSVVRKGYVANPFDPGDVDPVGRCTNPTCPWEY